MKKVNVWNIGLSILLLAGTLAGCGDTQPNSESTSSLPTNPQPPSSDTQAEDISSDPSSDTNTSPDSEPQKRTAPQLTAYYTRGDGLALWLYNDAQVESSNEDTGTTIILGEGGAVAYQSLTDGRKLPLVIRSNDNQNIIEIEPPSSATATRQQGLVYARNSGKETQQVIEVSAQADFIANGSSYNFGLVTYVGGQFYFHYDGMEPAMKTLPGLTPTVERVSQEQSDSIQDFLRRHVASSSDVLDGNIPKQRVQQTTSETAEKAAKAINQLGVCEGPRRIPIPCPK